MMCAHCTHTTIFIRCAVSLLYNSSCRCCMWWWIVVVVVTVVAVASLKLLFTSCFQHKRPIQDISYTNSVYVHKSVPFRRASWCSALSLVCVAISVYIIEENEHIFACYFVYMCELMSFYWIINMAAHVVRIKQRFSCNFQFAIGEMDEY